MLFVFSLPLFCLFLQPDHLFSDFVAAVPTMRKSKSDVTPPSHRARGGGKGMCAVGAIEYRASHVRVPVVGT